MKKLFAAVLSLVLALTLVGCSSSSNGNDRLTSIKENGKLVVGLEGEWQPFGYEDENGNLVGYDVEVAQAIADHIGVELELVPTAWDGLLSGLDSGVFDLVINGVDVTDERKASFDFSDAYAYDHAVLIVRDDNTEIQSFDDLVGKVDVNSTGSTYMDLAENYGATVKPIDSFAETLSLVAEGKADCTINANTSFIDYMNHEGGPFKVVDQSIEGTPYAVPIKKGNPELVKAVNEAIKEIRDNGKLAELSVKYFGEDLTN